MTTEIGLAAAHYAEKAVAALRDGDIAAAIGALASIDRAAWGALQERFPGFPSPAQVLSLSTVWHGMDSATQEVSPPVHALSATVDDPGCADVVTW